MIDLWKQDVDLFLPFEEDEPVPGDDDEEPEEELGEVGNQSKDNLDDGILALGQWVIRELRDIAPDCYLDDHHQTEDDHENNEGDSDASCSRVRVHLVL